MGETKVLSRPIHVLPWPPQQPWPLHADQMSNMPSLCRLSPAACPMHRPLSTVPPHLSRLRPLLPARQRPFPSVPLVQKAVQLCLFYMLPAAPPPAVLTPLPLLRPPHQSTNTRLPIPPASRCHTTPIARITNVSCPIRICSNCRCSLSPLPLPLNIAAAPTPASPPVDQMMNVSRSACCWIACCCSRSRCRCSAVRVACCSRCQRELQHTVGKGNRDLVQDMKSRVREVIQCVGCVG